MPYNLSVESAISTDQYEHLAVEVRRWTPEFTGGMDGNIMNFSQR